MASPLDILKKVQTTLKPTYNITASPISPQSFWESKFGGYPFLPKKYTYPTNHEGEPLHLLAQINLTELVTLPPFPRHGLLQFYIHDDEWYGTNSANPTEQNNFRVLHIPEVNTDDEIHSFNGFPTPKEFPICENTAHALSFTRGEMPLSITNASFEEEFIALFDNDDQANEFADLYDALIDHGAGHRMGGYPYFFPYEDPRGDDYKKFDTLLLQVASDAFIEWGSIVCGRFMISEEDLKNEDFSRIMYI